MWVSLLIVSFFRIMQNKLLETETYEHEILTQSECANTGL